MVGGSNPTPRTLREPRNFLAFLLTKTTLTPGTIKRRVRALKSLAKHVDLFDDDAVVGFLNTCNWSNGTKNIVVVAYQDWLRMYGLPKLRLPKYHVAEKLPFIPTEKEIDALINSARLRLSCFLRLLKETGVRPVEAWRLLWTDIDTAQRTVNIRTAKRGNPRKLRVSQQLLNMLGGLKKDNNYLFSPSGLRERFDTELEHFTRNYTKFRKRLASKLQNSRLTQISLYTFRHWKATMEYNKTKDILYVMRVLGHKNIKNTLKYTQLVNFEVDDYICKAATTVKQASELIETGYEYVCEMADVKLFRKRK